jgi:hypothetical protein
MHQTATKKKFKRVGRPSEPLIRWSINRASREFLIHRNTIQKQLDLVQLAPDDDGCYSSAEMLYVLSDFVRWNWSSGPPEPKAQAREQADIVVNNRKAFSR